jgi:hypothetical protein
MHGLKGMFAALVIANFNVISDGQGADLFREQSGVGSAVARYGVSGNGVVIAILDRGIEWQNPDFVNSDGTTRIKWLLDMSGQNWCDSSNPKPVEYSSAEINAALAGGPPLHTLDAVGHGTVTAGIAAGNGLAFPGGKHLGVAPEADLIVVKMTSEGAIAHGNQPAELAFNGCISEALDWVDEKITELGRPAVGLINSGVQLWGPSDGTSVVSRKIDQVFGIRPGRIFVVPSGDEGGLATHAGGMYSNQPTTVKVIRSRRNTTQLAMWFKGPPVSVGIEFDDDLRMVTAKTDSPGRYDGQNGSYIYVYTPGQEYPIASNSGDHFVNVELTGHAKTGRIILQGFSAEIGQFDIYSDPDAVTSFTDHLVPGRLTDYASTKSAIVIGAYVSANTWIDIDGTVQRIPTDVPGQLWSGSASGPARDKRRALDVVAPGETIFATYATNSYWATFRSALVLDGGGHYGRQGATSGASPIAVGAIALMLQMKPDLTSDQARDLLNTAATSDRDTGATPNDNWGHGKINVRVALDRLCALYRPSMCRN